MAGAIFGELFKHTGRWLKAAWLPWFLGIVLAIMFEQLYWRKIGSEPPPSWLFWFVLAPIPAMIVVRILKNIQSQVPVGGRELDLTREMWLTSMVIVALAVVFAALDWIRDLLLEYQVTIFEFEDFFSPAALFWLQVGW